MTDKLKIDGQVATSQAFTYDELVAISTEHQIADVSKLGIKRGGDAVTLTGLLDSVGAKASAKYIGLHASADNFHASIPLDPIRETALLIYRLDNAPLDAQAGGPFRFFIPNHAACHTDEIDECANVKFVDHIELTAEKGFDNRPTDDDEHEQLHANEPNH